MKRFLITSVILFILWQVAYRFLMLPSAVPDRALTQFTAKLSAAVLSFFYSDVMTSYDGYKSLIYINGHKTLGIAHYCNGLELMALYMGVLLALPGNMWMKLYFSIGGIASIFLLNIARCCLLVWLHFGDAGMYRFAHHYAFKLVVYFAAFYGWMLYVKYNPIRKIVTEPQCKKS